MKEKKNLTLIVVTIAVVLAAIAGAAFAYFTAQVGDGTDSKIDAVSDTTDSLMFEVGDPFSIDANQENFAKGEPNLQDRTTATARLVANNTTNKATATYYVYLDISTNGLIYTKEGEEPELVVSIKDPDGNYLTALPDFKGKTTDIDIYQDETRQEVEQSNVKGFDITGTTGIIPIALNYQIEVTDEELDHTKEQTWEIVLTLINFPEDEQNDNTGKSVEAKVIIQKDEIKGEVTGGFSLVDHLTTLAGQQTGDGYLYYHDSSLTDGAGDGSYRYAGNEPNNYVCLGTKTASGGCDDNKHLYRIIGVIPVKVGSQSQNLIKLIKSEYVTKEELGGHGSNTYGDSSSALTLNSSYAKNARIKNQSGINSFYWSGSNYSNEWQQSSLYTTLNDAYLTKLDQIGSTTWKDKIETVTWNIAGLSYDEYKKPAKDVFTIEMNNSTAGSEQTTTKTVNAQVGLMYASDYGFAASKDNWQTKLDSYGNDTNRSANWLYNAVLEWTISHSSSRSDIALFVYDIGYVNHDLVDDIARGVRPSFYLKSTVKYLEGEGSYEKPIFLG